MCGRQKCSQCNLHSAHAVVINLGRLQSPAGIPAGLYEIASILRKGYAGELGCAPLRRICAISCSLIEDPWKTPDRVVLDFLKKRENKIKGASEEIFDRIKNELDAGISAGDTRDELADRIRGVKLGDANTPIFWYRPKDSQTYHVIYGDLHAETVTAEKLAELEKLISK